MRALTVFETCPKHVSLFARETRYRCAETFVEGGPYGSFCDGGLCQMKPGTDFYTGTFVQAHDVYTAAMWEANRTLSASGSNSTTTM